MAEPKPIRLASPMMFSVTSTESSSSPLRPWLTAYTMSNARRASMTVMTPTMTLTGRRVGRTMRKKVWASPAPSIAAASFSEGSTAFSPAR